MSEQLENGVIRLETDYPEVANFPLWLYLVDGGDGSFGLIDSGVVSTYQRTLGPQLQKLGIPPERVTTVLNTHGHPDHMGGNAEWRSSFGARVAAGLADATWIENHGRHWAELWEGYPGVLEFSAADRSSVIDGMAGPDAPVDFFLRDGDQVTIGTRQLQVVVTHGHSPDHLCLWDPVGGYLFVGDVVQGGGQPWLDGHGLLAPLYQDVDAYVAGLRRLAEFPFTWLVRAHGAPVGRDEGLALIEESIGWTDRVDQFLDQQLSSQGSVHTTKALAKELGTKLGPFGGVTLQTVSVVQAHLERRARRGLVEPAWRVR